MQSYTTEVPQRCYGAKPPGIKLWTADALAPASFNMPAPPSAATLPAGPRPQRGAGGRGWGRRDRLGAAGAADPPQPSRSLQPEACLPASGAMGNCHTVGPNEALVVSGEGKARGGVGKGRHGVRVSRTHLSQPPESCPPHSTASATRPFLCSTVGLGASNVSGFQCWDRSSGRQVPDGEGPEARVPLFRVRQTR